MVRLVYYTVNLKVLNIHTFSSRLASFLAQPHKLDEVHFERTTNAVHLHSFLLKTGCWVCSSQHINTHAGQEHEHKSSNFIL